MFTLLSMSIVNILSLTVDMHESIDNEDNAKKTLTL